MYECWSGASFDIQIKQCFQHKIEYYSNWSYYWERLYDFLSVCRTFHLPIDIPSDNYIGKKFLYSPKYESNNTARISLHQLEPIPETFRFPETPFSLKHVENFVNNGDEDTGFEKPWRTLADDEPLPFPRNVPVVNPFSIFNNGT